MKGLKLTIWILLLWLAESTFSGYIAFFGVVPELLFAFNICVAFLEKKPSVYISIAVICGLLAEGFLGGATGVHLFGFVLSAILVVLLGDFIYRDSFYMIIPTTMVFTILKNTISFFLNFKYFQGVSYLLALWHIILPVMVYNTILAVLICYLLKKTIYKAKNRIRR